MTSPTMTSPLNNVDGCPPSYTIDEDDPNSLAKLEDADPYPVAVQYAASVDSGVDADYLPEPPPPAFCVQDICSDDAENSDRRDEVADDEDGKCCCGCWQRASGRCLDGCREVALEVGQLIDDLELCRRVNRVFSLNTVRSLFPITTWLPRYRSVSITSSVTCMSGVTFRLMHG